LRRVPHPCAGGAPVAAVAVAGASKPADATAPTAPDTAAAGDCGAAVAGCVVAPVAAPVVGVADAAPRGCHRCPTIPGRLCISCARGARFDQAAQAPAW
jgi:hypothetical protein